MKTVEQRTVDGRANIHSNIYTTKRISVIHTRIMALKIFYSRLIFNTKHGKTFLLDSRARLMGLK